jgi:hypothetical protein
MTMAGKARRQKQPTDLFGSLALLPQRIDPMQPSTGSDRLVPRDPASPALIKIASCSALPQSP